MNTTAFEEGYKAYENYQHLSDNPYVYKGAMDEIESGRHVDWEDGFYCAKKDVEDDQSLIAKWV